MNRLLPEQLAAGVQDLPSLPAVVMELLSSIEQDDIDISVLAKKVSYDQALTAKTLRLANSSSSGLQVRVTTKAASDARTLARDTAAWRCPSVGALSSE